MTYPCTTQKFVKKIQKFIYTIHKSTEKNDLVKLFDEPKTNVYEVSGTHTIEKFDEPTKIIKFEDGVYAYSNIAVPLNFYFVMRKITNSLIESYMLDKYKIINVDFITLESLDNIYF